MDASPADVLPFAGADGESESDGDAPSPRQDHVLAAARTAVGLLTPADTVRGLHFPEQTVLTRAWQLASRGHRILQLHPATQAPVDRWRFRITYLDAAQDAIRDEDWTEFRRTAWSRVRTPARGQVAPSAA